MGKRQARTTTRRANACDLIGSGGDGPRLSDSASRLWLGRSSSAVHRHICLERGSTDSEEQRGRLSIPPVHPCKKCPNAPRSRVRRVGFEILESAHFG